MTSHDHLVMPAIAMEDDLGIVYLIETAQQFWSELEDILDIPDDNSATLSQLDLTLKRFISLCAAYHEQYLQSPLQLEHAFELLLNSELFTFHSERMCEIIVDDLQTTTNPHSQLISYQVLLSYGRRRPDFLRSHKRWQPLIPLLMDHILVEIDPDIEDTYFGTGTIVGGSNNDVAAVPVPIEAKLRSLGVRLLYEVCRVQKLSVQDLRVFDDAFIDFLFELVEQTRNMHDDSFNYSVIKLIVALNEQFMVASLETPSDPPMTPITKGPEQEPQEKNRVLRVLMRRLGSSKTFGENMIFMLNRAHRTPDDLCMQLLVLKILYLLFTTKGTSEYFYTNDLCVLVDVFLRELVDLDEDSDSLRHTYLRVLHPLLTKTQLRDMPYKRPQIVYTLESLVRNPRIRDINPTTKRLVDRCLSGDWCVQFRKANKDLDTESDRDSYAGSTGGVRFASPSPMSMTHVIETPTGPTNGLKSKSPSSKTLKPSKSVEHLKSHKSPPTSPHLDGLRRSSNASATSSALSLDGIASATPPTPGPPPIPHPRRKGTSSSAHIDGVFSDRERERERSNSSHHHHPHPHPQSDLGVYHHYHASGTASVTSLSLISPPAVSASAQSSHRRTAPAPPKRRKPPAIPVNANGVTITAIKSSATSNPLK